MAIFGMFAAKPDHPLAAVSEMRKVAAEIARHEPREAVQEAMVWLESLAAASGFPVAMMAERLLALEEAAVPQMRRLGREFFALGPPSTGANALWETANGFWHLLATSTTRCIEAHQAGGKESALSKELAARMYGSALHAWAAVQKWQQFRYRRLPESFWHTVGQIYLAAVQRGIEQRRFEQFAGHGQTSIEAEYLKTLLMHVGAMDALPPLEIELGERLIAHFLPQFTLTRELRPGMAYWVDSGGMQAPARLMQIPEPTATICFFSGEVAHQAVTSLAERIRSTGAVPPEVILAGQYPPESVCRVLDHLAMCWSATPPVREHARRAIKAPLAVIHGFRESLQTIAYAASTERTRIPDLELWAVTDISRGGLAIHGTLGHTAWPCIGMLVTMKPDGDGAWLLGVVRRFSRGPVVSGDAEVDAELAAKANTASLGIETISRTASAVVADADGLKVDAIVLDLIVVGEYCRLAIPPDSVEKTVPLIFFLEGKVARLMPRETVETGPDYMVINFFVQSFS